MFDKLRLAVVEKIVDHLCDVQAKALVHLVQPVILQVAGKLREAVASGRGMTNDEVEACTAELLKPLLEAEEQAMGTHIAQMVGASQRANASSRVPPLTPPPASTGSDAGEAGGASLPPLDDPAPATATDSGSSNLTDAASKPPKTSK